MSVKHIGLVLDNFDTKNSTLKLVAIILADHADADGICWPSYKKIAHRANITERSVQRHVKELQELGIIIKLRTGSVIKKEGKTVRVSNLYKFLVGNLQPKEEKLSTDDLGITDTDVYLEDDTAVRYRSTPVSTKPSINQNKNHHAQRPVENYLKDISAGKAIDQFLLRNAR